ncbi:MAG: VOC family protein [Actinobacteria bacterium]|nr:VOC family protein [Actinomycetota bacterium]
MNRFHGAFPILYVEDVEETIDFYGSTFGFEATYRWGEGGKTVFAFLELEPVGMGVALRPPDEDEGRSFALWIYADDVDESAERLRAAGASEVLPPTDQPWGERMCSFIDADGHLVHVGAKV